MTPAQQIYHDRMHRALDHIDRHLDADLDLATISAVAAFSRYHFHRQFAALFGMTAHRYVQLARLKRASYRLAFRAADRVTDIAIDAGYDAPDAFARAFRRHFGQSPSAFRSAPDWAPWRAALLPLDRLRNRTMQDVDPDAVTIREFPDTPVATMTHDGDMTTIGDTIRRFIAWRRANRLSPANNDTYNIFHGDPQTDGRVDLCVATDRIFPASDGVAAGLIPGGRCAVLRVVGQADDLEAPALHLYRDWLPASGEEARDFPLFCRRVRFFPDVAEGEAITDLFLPLR